MDYKKIKFIYLIATPIKNARNTGHANKFYTTYIMFSTHGNANNVWDESITKHVSKSIYTIRQSSHLVTS